MDQVVKPGGGGGRQGTYLVVQWLGLHAPHAGALGPIPGQETRSHMLQLRVCMTLLKILHAITKTQCSQINKYLKILFFKKGKQSTDDHEDHSTWGFYPEQKETPVKIPEGGPDVCVTKITVGHRL